MKMISVSCGVSRQVITVTLSRLTQTVCALRSVHFTHDAIAGNSTYRDEHSRAASFDDLVGTAGQWQGHGDAERFGGLEVQEHLQLRRLLNGQITGLFALEHTASVNTS